MDARQFEAAALQDDALRALIREAADPLASEIELDAPDRYLTVTGADLLLTLVAYALYRWVKDSLDHRRALNETEALERRARVVADLAAGGVPAEDAQKVVTALSEAIAKRTEGDPALEAARALLKP